MTTYLFPKYYEGNCFIVQAFDANVANENGELEKLRKLTSAAFGSITMISTKWCI